MDKEKSICLRTDTCCRRARAGLTLAEIGAVVSRPLVGLDEESSELERLCLAARAAVTAPQAAAAAEPSDAEEGEDDEAGDSEEDAWGLDEVAYQPVQQLRLGGEGTAASHGAGAAAGGLLRGAGGLSGEAMECASSSRLSSGTLYNTSGGAGSFELSFAAAAGAAHASTPPARPALRPGAASAGEDDGSGGASSLSGGLLSAAASRSQEELVFDLDESHGQYLPGGFEPITPTAAGALSAFACKPSPGACSDAASLSFSPLPGHLPCEAFGGQHRRAGSSGGSPDERAGMRCGGGAQAPLLPAVTLPAHCGSLARGGDGRAWQRSKQAPRRCCPSPFP